MDQPVTITGKFRSMVLTTAEAFQFASCRIAVACSNWVCGGEVGTANDAANRQSGMQT